MAIDKVHSRSVPVSGPLSRDPAPLQPQRDRFVPAVQASLDSAQWSQTTGGLWAPRDYFSADREGQAVGGLRMRRPSVGAALLEELARFDEVPLLLTSGQDPMDDFFVLRTRALAAADDFLAMVDSLECYSLSPGWAMSIGDFRRLRRDLRLLRAYIAHNWKTWVRVYEKTSRLQTEEVSLSRMRTEWLVLETERAMREGDHRPYVLKFCLPFSKWNKLLGDFAATQMKWDLLAVFKEFFGAAPGRVTFMDSTGISVAMRGREYDPEVILRFVQDLHARLTRWFGRLISSSSGPTQNVRFVEGRIQVLNDRREWVDLSRVINGDVFVGAAQVGRVRPDDPKIRASVHAAEIRARARGEHVRKKNMTAAEGGVLDGTTPARELELGAGYFPEETIPTGHALTWSLYSIVHQVAKQMSGLNGFLSLRNSHLLHAVDRVLPLDAVVSLVRQVYRAQGTTGQDIAAVIHDILELYQASHDQDISDPFTYFFENRPHAVADFIDGAIDFMARDRGVASSLYEVVSASHGRDVLHRMAELAGPNGVLTRLGSVYDDLGILAARERWGRGQGDDLQILIDECHACAETLRVFAKLDTLDALEDARFPGKIKNSTFYRIVRRRFQGNEIYYIVFDFDNLANFLNNPSQALGHTQRFDLSKYALEALIFEAATHFGLTPGEDIIYTSPGGDEMEIVYCATAGAVRPEVFLDELRRLIGERFGHVRSPASHKVWVPRVEGTVLERWPLYDRPAGFSIAIDPQDESFVRRYLAGGEVEAIRGVRGFELLPGLKQGGFMVEGLPLQQFEGATRQLNRVDVSATYERVQVKRGEAVRAFEGRMQGLRRDGLGLVDEMKTRYGKGQTWHPGDEHMRAVLEEGQQEEELGSAPTGHGLSLSSGLSSLGRLGASPLRLGLFTPRVFL